jgi:hypothetical protein
VSGWEIISARPVCQGFPYGKNTRINIIVFQYVTRFISRSFRPSVRQRTVRRTFLRSTTSGMQKNATKYAKFVRGCARTLEKQASRALELV